MRKIPSAAFVACAAFVLAATAIPAANAAPRRAAAAGDKVFMANCAGCHGANGQGAPEIFPPLAANPFVSGDAKRVIHTVKYGLNGKIVVKGMKYDGQMPAWQGTLSDPEIAAVISYVRRSWGNKASAVTAAQVAAVHK
ncbi:MAG TPA: cytochrome c [Candidatus Elarobacter sp.]